MPRDLAWCWVIGAIAVFGALTLPAPAASPPRNEPAAVARTLDQIIQAQLDANKVPPSPRSDDAEFLRRAYLDITGRIPTLEQAAAFLADKQADKRAKLIDELLARPEFGRHIATIWRDLIVDRTQEMNQARQASWDFIDWMSGRLNQGAGWDEVVSDMLTAEGQSKKSPTTLFVLANRNAEFPRAENIVGSVGKLFMGINIRCAQCHDHPFVKAWKQDDFWGMAAFFGQVRDHTLDPNGGSPNPTFSDRPNPDPKKETAYVSRIKRQGLIPPMAGPSIAIPTSADPTKTARLAAAKYFLANAPTLDDKEPYRHRFAAWLTAPDNPYFARAAVNRFWALFFGRGLVNPIDDMGPNHPASHPELLALLEKEFQTSGFDLKHLIRCICNSAAYQRTSRPLPTNKEDNRSLSHMAIKQLNAEQMYDSLNIAVGRVATFNKDRDRSTAIFATREADDDPTELSHGIPQFLHQMNGGLANGNTYIASRFTQGKSKEEAIKNMYLGILSRTPRTSEIETATAFVDKSATPQDGYRDLVWALMNSAEFMFNH
jgi:hypothetical protein